LVPEERERPWTPSPAQAPFAFILANPEGDRHLAFDEETGRWLRLWQHREPEPLHTGRAVLLRPSDVDSIIKISSVWSMRNAGAERADDLIDELAEGVRQLVLHFARAAGAV